MSKEVEKMHKDYKIMLDEEFEVEFDALFDAFWTNDHPIWEECKVMNDLSEFTASPFENKTRKFNFKVKMGVPFGPSHAPVEITQTMLEDDRKNGKVICENAHKTDYPYADTFDIVHRYEFVQVDGGKSRMKFFSRQEWRKKVPFVQGALNALVNHKQGIFVKNVAKVIRKYTNEEIKNQNSRLCTKIL
ncbi:unnamed protein product [Oikopleura dioica]|uniref:VASt domain-containing protein n=1 Tax=Oikopleura dioica TaxID=34765 RepID=E4XYH8_OIKDI|nr:unnamed protein product [Oikopleura dioica]CBY41550.1 unnamed protein product [Oikopleura dioica]CBY41655.1 unnamed protein product [Oikopleura dioica]